ncbi:MAG: family 43 glycosylhydrolase, partial [Muribaculaceae bacterium]|nr:family 43 glycosylhydrolase [Muribaculaceae bacterium]
MKIAYLRGYNTPILLTPTMKYLLNGAFALAALAAPIAASAEVPAEKDLAGYLFTYFTGNHINQEQIHFGLSVDGHNFYALNDNLPVISSSEISSTGGVRDPHILRREDGEGFYMVVTDMVSDNGWDSNRAMVLMKSPDLVNWEHSIVNIQKRYPDQANLKRVWAPQTVYDHDAGKYMVYWSMQHGDGPDIIYYAYANPDFTDLEGDYKPLFIPADGKSCIDGDIVYRDGKYHLFYKTEGHGNGIKVATTDSLTSGRWTEQPDYKQQTPESVEGAGTFKLIGQDKYILMYDVYMKGKYQFTETDDLSNFKVIDNEISMNFHPRHGTIIPITRAEMQRLMARWPSADMGNLTVAANPVLPGFHADPEILHSRRDGLYYLYSTTDGTPGWGGTYYTCYSSPDLTEWTYRGNVLDLATDQVEWADGNCWAPAIEEKLIDGKYKYFLYFSGNPVAGGGKQIGVAIADSPTGPFVDLGHPIVTSTPEVARGQEIDVDVFTDPVSGKSYLYWGNGYMAGAELAPDMTSIIDSTLTVMTPRGGSLKTYAYREAPYVFYHDGRYYFMWSVDDTGSPNYHVAYGTATSPLGPITVAKNPVILSQDPAKGIYGPAHNSVVSTPATGDWRIVYHRINPAYLDNEPGIHREVCIDRMTINPDGTI